MSFPSTISGWAEEHILRRPAPWGRPRTWSGSVRPQQGAGDAPGPVDALNVGILARRMSSSPNVAGRTRARGIEAILARLARKKGIVPRLSASGQTINWTAPGRGWTTGSGASASS